MHKAYEVKEEFSADGKRIVRREWSVGPIVPWAIVALAMLAKGNVILPPGFWALFQ